MRRDVLFQLRCKKRAIMLLKLIINSMCRFRDDIYEYIVSEA